MLEFIALCLLVVAGSALGDYVYVRWMQACAARTRLKASAWSMSCTFVANGMVLLVVPEPWLLVPLCVGNGVGTWFALRNPAKPSFTGAEAPAPNL